MENVEEFELQKRNTPLRLTHKKSKENSVLN